MNCIFLQLANVLEVETELVKQAVSLYCRLKFARKLDAETDQAKLKRHPSWNQIPINIVRYLMSICGKRLNFYKYFF